jgi:septum formation protein
VTRLILASGSAIRAQLLELAGVPLEIVRPHVDEEAVRASLKGENAPLERVAEVLAEMKAQRASNAHHGALVIGSDLLLAFDGEAIGKSADIGEARTLLRRLRGKEHQLIGATVLVKDGAVIWRHLAVSKLWLRDFSDAFLEDYLAREGEAALSSVGCYRLEGLGAQLFSRIDGDYFAVLGLALLPLLAALREHGVIAS